MTKTEALQTIVSSNQTGIVDYAKSYAAEALKMQEGSLEFNTQLQYVLCNLQYWRHPEAKRVRQVLKS